MKYFISAVLIILFQQLFAQQKRYTPKIEPCACAFKADSSLKTRCAYLVVPENRNKPDGKTIKLPFIYVESNNPNKHKDPVLYTAGGPGASSLGGVRFIHRRQFFKDRDYIAFEQRGTWFAQPRLDCFEVADAIKESYRKGLNKDSMILVAVKACRKRLAGEGIDLSAYNTIENAADIEDLRRALNIDSINLIGISYSGGLMMTVMRNYPEHVRSVILDSALPGFVNYEEDALFSINEAFNKIFSNCDRDSTDKALYGNMKQRFQQYFTAIGNRSFYINYKEKDKPDSIRVKYTRDELLDMLVDKLQSNGELKNVPYIINQVIAGQQQPYMKAYFDGVFNAGTSTNGMRYSMYCSEQIAYASQALIDKQNEFFPYFSGYHFNDVNHPICNCWNVKPVDPIAKTPVFSNIPTLLGSGDTDPYCRPVYNDIIHHYMPNSQRVLFTDKTHAPLLNTKYGDELIAKFISNPYQKIVTDGKNAVTY
ncbi:MAG TPA: alpha/beta fold hydrolase [Mucilaginibacter sp.]|nr:alpha/beta fold hydrolase [Mucilaginibacter sp.]